MNLLEILVFIGFQATNERPRIYSTIEAIVTTPLTNQITHLLWLMLPELKGFYLLVNKNKAMSLFHN